MDYKSVEYNQGHDCDSCANRYKDSSGTLRCYCQEIGEPCHYAPIITAEQGATLWQT